MQFDELKEKLNQFRNREIVMFQILNAVEQYRRSPHDGKPDVSGSLPPDAFVQSLRDLRSWVVSSEEVSYDEERAIRQALADILYHLKNVKERR